MKTKKSSIVAGLKEKHKERLGRALRELKKDKRIGSDCLHSPDVLLFSKWAYRVGKGWYGFDLCDVPRVWTDVLDDFLSWLTTVRVLIAEDQLFTMAAFWNLRA